MSLRILHLDDDPQDSKLVQSLLQAAGIDCHFVSVATEPEFVAALERKSVDLTLSDSTLPGFQGHAALSIAVKKCPAAPFIFVSGTIGEDVAIESLKSGATDYVLKQKMSRLVPAVHGP
jgi:sigma-B regulation protein RsbU (phosphoserine phosphatase)